MRNDDWIPVTYRPMDKEEREMAESEIGKLTDEEALIFDCPMPEDGEEILISTEHMVSADICSRDGLWIGLESYGDWFGVLAWMPMPDPYKKEEGE